MTEPATEGSRALVAEASGLRRMRPAHPLALAIVVVCSVVASAGYLLLSRYGVHATNDSFTYLGAAQNLAQGEGWTYPFGDIGAPVTLFPPVYPLTLAVPELLGIEVFHWVTWQNAILLGVLSSVVGLVVERATGGSVGAILTAITLTVLGTSTVLAYAHIWSEPLFYPVEIVALASVGSYLFTGRSRNLVAAAALTSLAMLTRYAALPLLVTCCLVVAARPQTMLARIRELGLFLSIALPLSILWSLRNLSASGSLTGDNGLIPGLAASDVRDGVRTITAWFAPPAPAGFSAISVAVWILVTIALALSMWLIAVKGLPRWSYPAAMAVVCVAFALLHFLFIAIANAFSTRSPPFNDRILGPMFVPLVLALVLGGHVLWQTFQRPLVLRVTIAITAILLITASWAGAWDNVPNELSIAAETRSDFVDLAGELHPWLDADAFLSSNRPNIAWFVVERNVAGLPRSCLGGRVLPNPSYDRELSELAVELADAPRQVLVFKQSRECQPFSIAELKETLALEELARRRNVLILRGPVGGST